MHLHKGRVLLAFLALVGSFELAGCRDGGGSEAQSDGRYFESVNGETLSIMTCNLEATDDGLAACVKSIDESYKGTVIFNGPKDPDAVRLVQNRRARIDECINKRCEDGPPGLSLTRRSKCYRKPTTQCLYAWKGTACFGLRENCPGYQTLANRAVTNHAVSAGQPENVNESLSARNVIEHKYGAERYCNREKMISCFLPRAWSRNSLLMKPAEFDYCLAHHCDSADPKSTAMCSPIYDLYRCAVQGGGGSGCVKNLCN